MTAQDIQPAQPEQPVRPGQSGQPVLRVGITGYSSYVPAYRLGADAGVRGRRVVAAFDENATTMAVEAASRLGAVDVGPQVLLATTSPPYLDKNNASAIHAALRLSPEIYAGDTGGAVRSTFAALRAAHASGGLVIASDVRVGKAGSADEKGGADAAAAVLFGENDIIAEVLALASVTEELLDRWRPTTSLTGQSWEERFGFERYSDLVRATATATLDRAGLTEADHVLVTSPNSAVAKKAGTLVKGTLSTGGNPVGFAGCSDPLIALASALDVANPGETILVLSAADGCDAILVRTTELLTERRQAIPLSDQLATGLDVPYPTYLGWRGLLDRETPRRPEPDRPAGPPSHRGADWKFGFTGSRCTACGFVHLPPLRVCRNCSAVDQMEPRAASRLQGTVATFTIDRLAYSPSPPVIDAIVDLDGGGRCALEVADAVPDDIDVGTRVEFCFRSLFTVGGVHNYFWKAKVLS